METTQESVKKVNSVGKYIQVPNELNNLIKIDLTIQNPFSSKTAPELIIAIVKEYYATPKNLARIHQALGITAVETSQSAAINEKSEPQQQAEIAQQ